MKKPRKRVRPCKVTTTAFPKVPAGGTETTAAGLTVRWSAKPPTHGQLIKQLTALLYAQRARMDSIEAAYRSHDAAHGPLAETMADALIRLAKIEPLAHEHMLGLETRPARGLRAWWRRVRA